MPRGSPTAGSACKRVTTAGCVQAKKPQLGRWLDSFGEVYARAVIAAVVASFLALLALGVPLLSQGARRGALYRALGLLTTASPCALVLVPLAYVSAIAAVSSRCRLPPLPHRHTPCRFPPVPAPAAAPCKPLAATADGRRVVCRGPRPRLHVCGVTGTLSAVSPRASGAHTI